MKVCSALHTRSDRALIHRVFLGLARTLQRGDTMRNTFTMIIVVAAAAGGSDLGCSSAPAGPSCPMGTAPASCVSFGPTATEDAIQTAFATAKDGTVFMFSAATYWL